MRKKRSWGTGVLFIIVSLTIFLPGLSQAQNGLDDSDVVDVTTDQGSATSPGKSSEEQDAADFESELEAQETPPPTAQKPPVPPAAQNPTASPTERVEPQPIQEFSSETEEAPPATAEKKEDTPVEEVPPPAPSVAEPESPVLEEPLAPPSEPLTPVVSEPVGPDDPDLNYESKLHEIYTQYYGTKISADKWESIVGSKSSERYRIRSGDNLWNISKTLFGDGNYWPKVWSLNGGIKNPHLVSPNNSIQFILGDESAPPAFAVTENDSEKSTQDESSNLAAPEAAASSGESDSSAPEIPPPNRVSNPVLKKLPPSLPEWQTGGDSEKFDASGIFVRRRKILDLENVVYLSSYVQESEPESLGKVIEIESGFQIASTNQYVYVSAPTGTIHTGEVLLSIKNRGKIERMSSQISGDMGYAVDIEAELEILNSVGEGKDGSELFRAKVINSLSPVRVGSQLQRARLEKIQISEEGPRSDVRAQIIGGSIFNRRQIYGDETIAYLNKGSDSGLKVGDVLPIVVNRSLRDVNAKIESSNLPIGTVRVVRVTPKFATIIVLHSWSDVFTGDFVGGSTAHE